jgi:hypothetical protein
MIIMYWTLTIFPQFVEYWLDLALRIQAIALGAKMHPYAIPCLSGFFGCGIIGDGGIVCPHIFRIFRQS